MKKLIISAAAIFFTSAAVFTSCNQAEPETIPVQENSSIDPSHLDIIAGLGFDTSTIEHFGDFYVVEGDIMLCKNRLEDYLVGGLTRQARYKEGVVSRDNASFITYYIDTGVSPEWTTAIVSAVSAWNSVTNCCVRFYRLSTHGDVTISMYPGPANVTTLTTPPFEEMPGQYMKINSAPNSLTPDQKAAVLVHAFGHILGLVHTDGQAAGETDGLQIEGTPQSDDNSIMNSVFDGRGWTERGGFSHYDLYAIRALYPDYSGPYLSPSGTYVSPLPSLNVSWNGPTDPTVTNPWTVKVIGGPYPGVTVRLQGGAGEATVSAFFMGSSWEPNTVPSVPVDVTYKYQTYSETVRITLPNPGF